jgi:apolipoprotein D and lipocalin family protein
MKTIAMHLSAVALVSLVASSVHASENPRVAKVGLEHYSGKWLEIGRTPMLLTNGCVAGYSTYSKGKQPNEVAVDDGCRANSPKGPLKTIHGSGLITDFGTTNARMRVRYPLLITFNYWVRYEAPDKSWFISSTPDMSNLWIYARHIPTKRRLEQMVKKAKALGYDVGKLEFPTP